MLVAAAVVVPFLNALVPASSALHFPDYLVPILGKFMCFAMVALALDLVWGYAGILSLGHGLFFALGGYAMGMYLMRSIRGEGVYRSDLPDFMVFLDWKALPWYWHGFHVFWFAVAMAVGARALQGAQQDRGSADGGLGWYCGWQSFREHNPTLETIRPQRSRTDLGRRSGGCIARGARQSQPACNRATHRTGPGATSRSIDARASNSTRHF